MMCPIIANNWVCGQQAGSIESRINLRSPHTDELDILRKREKGIEMTISFEGRVAIVTESAGGGLGKQHALELWQARRKGRS